MHGAHLRGNPDTDAGLPRVLCGPAASLPAICDIWVCAEEDDGGVQSGWGQRECRETA